MRYFICFFLLFPLATLSAQDIAIIPQPVTLKKGKGAFRLTPQTIIGYGHKNAKPVADFLAARLSVPTGYRIKVQQQGQIQLRLNSKPNEILGKEGYTLEVTTQGVRIAANESAGLFYGVQSLLQLFPPAIDSKTRIKKVRGARRRYKLPIIRVSAGAVSCSM